MAVNSVPVSVNDSGASVNVGEAMAIFAFLGTADADSPTAINTPMTIATEGDVEEFFLGGPLVEVAKASVGFSRQGAVAVRVETNTAGSYGSVVLNDSDYPFTGTAVPTADATAVPINDFEVVVEFPAGGVPGTAGITYRVALDGVDANGDIRTIIGRTRQLGTSTVITIKEAGSDAIAARFTLLPPAAQVTALVTLTAELRTDRLAHYAAGATTHNSADTTSGVAIGGVPTDLTTSIARLNQIRTADLTHAANVVAHNSADTTSYALMPAACTDGPTAIALAIYLKTGGNAHNANATVHDNADVSNDITATSPTNGTVEAGDRFTCPVHAPTFNAAGITAAFAALRAYTSNVFTAVVIRGAMLPAYWAALVDARDDMAAAPYERPTVVLIETRLPSAESDTAFRAALDGEWTDKEDADVYRCANYLRYDPGDISQLRGKYLRTELVPLACRLQALDYGASPTLVANIVRSAGSQPSVFGGRLEGARVTELGALIGHDERFQPGLRDAGFGVLTSYALKPPADVYVHDAKTAAPSANRAPGIQQRRVIVAVVLAIKVAAIDIIGRTPAFEPGKTTLRSDIADAIDAFINDSVRATLGARVDSFTFAVDRNATISLTDTIIEWMATVVIAGAILELPGILSVNKVGG